MVGFFTCRYLGYCSIHNSFFKNSDDKYCKFVIEQKKKQKINENDANAVKYKKKNKKKLLKLLKCNFVGRWYCQYANINDSEKDYFLVLDKHFGLATTLWKTFRRHDLNVEYIEIDI